MSETDDGLIEIEKMSIDQLAGAVVLFLGAVGSLLLVIWQSRCACKCRIGCSEKCYIFDCSREPPPINQDNKDKNKKDKNKEIKKEKIETDNSNETEEEDEESPSLTPNSMSRKN
jgi:hypothetical protein